MNLIYYPYLEMKNERFIKTALLYLTEIHTIMPTELYTAPYNKNNKLSENFYKIKEGTNLITPILMSGEVDGDYFHVLDVMENAGTEFVNLLRQKEDEKDPYFMNKLMDWKKRENQNFEIYDDKYAGPFLHFVFLSELGHSSQEGIKVSDELGYLYMGMLAHAVSQKTSINTITDSIEVDEAIYKLKEDNQSSLTYKNEIPEYLRINILDLPLPKNIDQISIEEIIKFRNRAGYLKKLDAFHQEANDFIMIMESRESTNTLDFNKFKSHIEELNKEISGEIAGLSAQTFGIGLGVWLALQGGNDNEGLSLLKETMGIVGLSPSFKLARNRKKMRQVKQTRKFLFDLKV